MILKMCLNKTFTWNINVLKSIFFPKKTLYPKRMIQCQAMMMIMTISLHHRLSFFTSYFLGVALTLSLVWLVLNNSKSMETNWMMSMKNTLKNHFSREEKKTTLSILKTFQQAKLRLGCQFKVSNATETIILPVSLRS